jgi:UDP-N-acetylglucosamine 2-epimerase (non-hydrolysing)
MMRGSSGGTSNPRVYLFAGTRPEAVKLAPLLPALTRIGVEPTLVDTGQQPGRVVEALAPFGLGVDRELGIQRIDGGLNELLSIAIARVDELLRHDTPDAVVVQGDTSTALAVGLAAAMLDIATVHLEAGLRTGCRIAPFPEETNRTLLADLATLQLAPSIRAVRALAREGHSGPHVVLTGNTVVDALEQMVSRLVTSRPHGLPERIDGRLLSVTVHRREAWGAGVRSVCRSVRTLLGRYADLHAAVVTHPNPLVAREVRAALDGVPRCHVLEPLPYDQMLGLLRQSDVALTDSGGIQEEAPTLRLPVVVARGVTERPEGVDAGWSILAGLDHDAIVASVANWLDRPELPPIAQNPYGDGHAAPRAAEAIAWLLGRATRPSDWIPPTPIAIVDHRVGSRSNH